MLLKNKSLYRKRANRTEAAEDVVFTRFSRRAVKIPIDSGTSSHQVMPPETHASNAARMREYDLQISRISQILVMIGTSKMAEKS